MDPLVQENIETATETAAIVAIPQHMVQPEPQPHLAEKDISPMKESIMRADSNASEGIIIDSTALLPRNTVSSIDLEILPPPPFKLFPPATPTLDLKPLEPLFLSFQVVRIAGNNRTKASLIGLQATVRRSIGLGGWHWLVLPDGSEIKLQRNALTVLEYPTGLEAESSASEGERHKPVTPLAFAATNTTSSAALRPGELPLDFRMPIKRARPSTPVAGDFQDVRRTSLRQQQQHAAAASTLYFEPVRRIVIVKYTLPPPSSVSICTCIYTFSFFHSPLLLPSNTPPPHHNYNYNCSM